MELLFTQSQTMKPKLTRELAWAASQDAANQTMRAGGRTAWSEEDYNVAVAEFDRLWPARLDIKASKEIEGLPHG